MQQEVHLQTEADHAHQVGGRPVSPNLYLSCQDAHGREAFLLSSLSTPERQDEQSQRSHSEESRDVLAGGGEADGHLRQDGRGHPAGGRGGRDDGAEVSGELDSEQCGGGVPGGPAPAPHLLQLTGAGYLVLVLGYLVLLSNRFICAVS